MLTCSPPRTSTFSITARCWRRAWPPAAFTPMWCRWATKLTSSTPTEPPAITTSPTTAMGGRTEAIGNLFLPPQHAAGKHEFKLGVDIDRIDDHQEFNRQPYVVERTSGTVTRRRHLYRAPRRSPAIDAESGGYAQDRWSHNPAVAGGARHALRCGCDCPRRRASPRIASTFMLKRNGDRKHLLGHRRLPRPQQP